jgi:hypothetical protein
VVLIAPLATKGNPSVVTTHQGLLPGVRGVQTMTRQSDVGTLFDPRPEATGGLGLKHVVLVWWVAYLVASPFYVLASGNPQPADVGMAVLMLVLMTGYFARIPLHQTLYFVAALFLTHVALVNWFWWLQIPDLTFLMSSIFYLYDFLVVIVIITLARAFGDDFWKFTRIGIIAMLLIEAGVVLFLPEFRGIRATGTFNNPNQLGYWSLLTAACYLSLKGSRGQPSAGLTFFDLGVLCLLVYVSMQSLSKAAMISCAALFIAAVCFQGALPRVRFAIAALLLIGTIVVANKGADDIQEWFAEGSTGLAIARLDNIGKEGDDSWEGRGYDRIWENPEYLILGAGEGGVNRFNSLANEIHSTFGTVLFSYGILGFVLFLLLLWLIFRPAELRYFVYFVPVCLYGLTHQGLRFTLLWIFLGLVFARTRYDQPRAIIASHTSPPAFDEELLERARQRREARRQA